MEWPSILVIVSFVHLIVAQDPCPENSVLEPCICTKEENRWIIICENYNEFDSVDKLKKSLRSITSSFDEIRITKWFLPIIPSGIFKNITKKLKIIDCKVNSLSNDVFLGNGMLEHLTLAKNNITQIPFEALKSTPILKELILSQNYITFIPNLPIEGLKYLEVLELNENNFGGFPVASNLWESLSQLKKLDLSKCGIKTIQDGVIAGLERLETLNLNDNKLGVIDENAFQSLTFLKHLKLSRCELNRIPVEILKISQLLELDLSENSIESIPPEAFKGLRVLMSLTLQNNKIKEVSVNAFKGLTSLQNLYMERNEINILKEGFFQGLSSLKGLFLERNVIRNVDSYAFLGLPVLNTLNLRENRLETLNNMSLISIESSLTQLQLQGNPLICDCSLEWFIIWLQRSRLTNKNIGTCVKPQKLKDKTTDTISPEELKECYIETSAANKFNSSRHILIANFILLFIYKFFLSNTC